MQAKATIDERGAIAIPAAMRQALGLRPNDEVRIEATELGLLIRPVLSGRSGATPRSGSRNSPVTTRRSAS